MLAKCLCRVEHTAKRLAPGHRTRVVAALAAPRRSGPSHPTVRFSTSSLVAAEDGFWNVLPSSKKQEPLIEAALHFKRALTDIFDPARIRSAYSDFRELYLEGGERARRILETPAPVRGWRWVRTMEQERDSTITPGVLQDAVDILSGTHLPTHASPDVEDVQLAAQIVLDMPQLFGMQCGPQSRSTVLSGMSRVDPYLALDWLAELEGSQLSDSAVSLDDYVTVMQGFVQSQDEKGMHLVLDRVRNHWTLRPSAVLWQPYIKYLATASTDNETNAARLEASLRDMEAGGVSPTAPIVSDMLLQCIVSGNLAGAEKHCDALRELLEPESLTLTHSELCYAVAALVRYAGMCGGYPAAVEEAVALRKEGFRHNSHTMRVLLNMEGRPDFDAATLIALADSLDVEPTPAIWGIIIKRALELPDGLNIAFAIYTESKLRGVI